MPDPMKLPPGAQLVSNDMALPPGASLVSGAPSQRTWLDSVKDFAGELWGQVNPVEGVKGLAQAASHPQQAVNAMGNAQDELRKKAEAAFKRGDYAEGVGHALYYLMPVVGPQADKAGESFMRGDYAKGAGASTGIGLNLAAPAAMKGKITVKLPGKIASGAQGAAEEMYQSALKPNLSNDATKINTMVQTGLDSKIPISPAGVDKIGTLIEDLNRQVTAEIQANPGRTINKFKVASRLGDTANQFSQQVNPVRDLKNISEAGNEFLATQPPRIAAIDAQNLKVGTYRQLAGKYGELGNASMEAQKALARGVKEELSNAFPELNALNGQEAKLLDLQPALERAVKRIGNHQLIGIGTPIAGGAAGVVTGSGKIAAATAAVKAVLDNPIVKSKLAIALNHASKGGITISAANARIQGYVNLLGQSSGQSEQGTE